MAVIAASGALNVVISIARPTAIWISDREALWNLCFDLVLLAALLCLTGGLQNPFSILILAPVVISGWALSRRSTLILSTLAVALVSFLAVWYLRSDENTSELQSLMRISYAVFCLQKKPYMHFKS